jgi:hypothetical protein
VRMLYAVIVSPISLVLIVQYSCMYSGDRSNMKCSSVLVSRSVQAFMVYSLDLTDDRMD